MTSQVKANNSKHFLTYAAASRFIDEITKKYGIHSFEGIQVRGNEYIVNYFTDKFTA